MQHYLQYLNTKLLRVLTLLETLKQHINITNSVHEKIMRFWLAENEGILT